MRGPAKGDLTLSSENPDALHLPVRIGIPDAVAYLRGAHPKAGWRGHANYGELADFWLQVHDSLRAHGGELSRATRAFADSPSSPADFQRVFAPRFNQFIQHLHAHHHIEDSAYFPKFRALDGRMAAGFELLESDHVIIHETLLASVESARALLATLARNQDALRFAAERHAADSERLLALLLRHLADEEDLVIPAMLEHGERSLK